MSEQRRATPERPDWIWHDVEELLRRDHDVDDDTFKGLAKDIYNLFLANGWTHPGFRRFRWRRLLILWEHARATVHRHPEDCERCTKRTPR